MDKGRKFMIKIFHIIAVVIAFLCVFSENYEQKQDKLEKVRIFLSYKIPQDTQVLEYTNGFRNFMYDVKYKSKTINLETYKEKIKRDGWQEAKRKGWLRDGEKEDNQTIYVRGNYIYVITKQDDTSWREIVVNK